MKSKQKKFITSLSNRPVLIWGARMTGIGLLRFAKKHNLNIVTKKKPSKREINDLLFACLLYTSPSPRDRG